MRPKRGLAPHHVSSAPNPTPDPTPAPDSQKATHPQGGMDWPGLLRAGIGPQQAGGLGLTPEVFWALTPAELRLMLGRAGAGPDGAMMTRARLDDLATRFPDKPHKEGEDDGTQRHP